MMADKRVKVNPDGAHVEVDANGNPTGRTNAPSIMKIEDDKPIGIPVDQSKVEPFAKVDAFIDKQKRETDAKKTEIKRDAGYGEQTGAPGVSPNSMPDMSIDEGVRFRKLSFADQQAFLKAKERVEQMDMLEKEPNLHATVVAVTRNNDDEIVSANVAFSPKHPNRINRQGIATLNKLYLQTSGNVLAVGLTGVIIYDWAGGPVPSAFFIADKEQATN
jgi:hypothetical protein